MSDFLNDPEKVRVLFREIADIKGQKAQLEIELKKKEAIAFAYMREKAVDRVEVGTLGKFIKIETPMYEYSEQVKGAEAQVKVLKKQEEDQGIATVKATRTQLRFNALKED